MNRPEINVTPLIDVLLVLLIIFMIITPIRPTQVEAKAPREQVADKSIQAPLALVVSVDTAGGLSLNGEKGLGSTAAPDQLIRRLTEIFVEREGNKTFARTTQTTDAAPEIEKTVFIKAPRALDYGSVARVVDAVKSSGANPVGLQLDGLD